MKKRLIQAGVATLIITASTYLYSEIGSSNDPLVSKSYVDGKITELRAIINSNSGNITSGEIRGDNQLTVVNLYNGQSIIGENGTEIILRAGNATAIGSELGGLSDVTSGRDISDGGYIEKNHHLIIPRNDGRGVKANGDAIFMVRGSYRID